MSDVNLPRLEKIVRETGDLLLGIRDKGAASGHWEGAQFKAEGDLLAHEFLAGALKEAFHLPVISEEDTSHNLNQRPEEYFLIDPIDGTRSYAEGFAGFVTQAALVRNGRPVLAAVSAPALGLHYSASAGGGSFLNSRAMDKRKPGSRILIDNFPRPEGSAGEIFRDLGFHSYVECGSISLKICRVADGTADLFFKDVVIRDWDIAPAQLILEEAGGILSDLQGQGFPYSGSFEHPGLLAASTAALHGEAVEWFEKRRRN